MERNIVEERGTTATYSCNNINEGEEQKTAMCRAVL